MKNFELYGAHIAPTEISQIRWLTKHVPIPWLPTLCPRPSTLVSIISHLGTPELPPSLRWFSFSAWLNIRPYSLTFCFRRCLILRCTFFTSEIILIKISSEIRRSSLCKHCVSFYSCSPLGFSDVSVSFIPLACPETNLIHRWIPFSLM